MIIKIDLTDEQLNKLDYCVGLIDRDNPNDVAEAVQTLFDSCRENKELLISHQKAVRNLEERHQCRLEEQAAKHKEELYSVTAELKNLDKLNEELRQELKVANAQIRMIETIFGRGAR